MVTSTPPALVAQLHADEAALATAITAWAGNGTTPATVVKLAVDRERLMRQIALAKQSSTAVLKLAPDETDDVKAERDLLKLGRSTPPPKGQIELRPAPPATKLLGWYQEAQQRFGVRWQLLAAINFIESAFGRVRNESGDGAQGPMQFEPATWKAYGLGGNIHDTRDAIMGAANYLAANHGSTDERTALFHYNPSPLYVDAVLHYAHRIAHVPTAFLEYYAR
ncbi:MAG TPA: transglycosylase SLT domain-containing protein [Gaiellaceae bacterium]|nr:transglycosylase SLT domain-containing protein [Gaiellaceae bacterium]